MVLRITQSSWRQSAENPNTNNGSFTHRKLHGYRHPVPSDGGAQGWLDTGRVVGKFGARLPSITPVSLPANARVPLYLVMSLAMRWLGAKLVQSQFQMNLDEMGRKFLRTPCFISPLLNPLCFCRGGFLLADARLAKLCPMDAKYV